MTIAAFAFVYLFGGLTFIPLLLAAILIPAWRLLPLQDEQDTRPAAVDGDSLDASKSVEQIKAEQAEHQAPDAAASGTFAVLRSYNFPSATAALTGRANNTNTSTHANPGDGAADTGFVFRVAVGIEDLVEESGDGVEEADVDAKGDED